MVYIESPEVPREIARLTGFINKNWAPIKQGYGSLSPLDLSADAQRWLVSIHPIGNGNGRISRMLQDAIAQDFGLPFAPTGYLTWDQTKPKLEYRQHVKDQYSKLMGEIEECLSQYRNGGKIHPHCRPLYSTQDNGDEDSIEALRKNVQNRLKNLDTLYQGTNDRKHKAKVKNALQQLRETKPLAKWKPKELQFEYEEDNVEHFKIKPDSNLKYKKSIYLKPGLKQSLKSQLNKQRKLASPRSKLRPFKRSIRPGPIRTPWWKKTKTKTISSPAQSDKPRIILDESLLPTF